MMLYPIVILGLVSNVLSSPHPRALPTPVSAATARTYLASLTVAPENNSPAYDRTLFGDWITVSGSCNTRETVLKRDGTNVVTDSACSAVSGNWVSPYDGVPTTLASDLDIDHLVPLKDAWVSGARLWTTSQRIAFANDLTRPQLVAVTDKLSTMAVTFRKPLLMECLVQSLNQAKGDQDPATWVPPLTSYRCIYVRAWVQVKYYYGLTVDSAEKTALTNYLANC